MALFGLAALICQIGRFFDNTHYVYRVTTVERRCNDLTDGKTHIFFILDDLCSEAINSPDVCRMFMRDSHHRALSVAITYQNLYEQGKKSKSIALSTEYLILFKNPRDNFQISLLGR